MDPVELAGSLIAIFVLAFIASRLFPTRPILSNKRVLRNVARFCPDLADNLEQADIFIGNKGAAAVLFFPDENNGFALVTAFGDRVVVRHLTNADDLAVKSASNGLVLSTHDYTQPEIRLALDTHQASALAERLSSSNQSRRTPAHA